MNKTLVSLLLLGAVAGRSPLAAQGEEQPWEPKRINRVIELLDAGQPVYYTQVDGGGYEEGLELAHTSADYISYNMEHSYVDVHELREFMRGLVDGGPTRSGHRTPTVIAVLPAIGWSEVAMRANTWVVQQVMAAGVHGLLLTHAVDPAAVRIMVEAIRYPFAPITPGLAQGMQGNGSAGFAADIWGIPQNEYLQKADPWPLNPNGEVFIGLKIENIHSVENVDQLVRVPGVGFAEWGPGDQGYWLGAKMGAGQPARGDRPELQEIRSRVLQATKDASIFFLNVCNDDNVAQMIDEGVMICTGGWEVGRQYTERRMPW